MTYPSINCLVYSKDRACQLDAFIRSMKHQWRTWNEEAKVSVIWTYSEESFLSGYTKLINDHPDVKFINQKSLDFKSAVTGSIDLSLPYTVQFVDDIIFINPFSLNDMEFKKFIEDAMSTCLSLRIHPKISYCYMLNRFTHPPEDIGGGKWLWENLEGEFGYPFSLDGHIIRTEDLKACLFYQEYTNPNVLEDIMSRFTIKRPYMRCYPQAKIINIPSNRVGSYISNRHGSISPEYLNNQYLNGFKIDVNAFYGAIFNAVHYEMDYLWVM